MARRQDFDTGVLGVNSSRNHFQESKSLLIREINKVAIKINVNVTRKYFQYSLFLLFSI